MASFSVELQTRLRERSRSICSIPLVHHDDLAMTLPGTVPIYNPLKDHSLASVEKWKSSANLASQESDFGKFGRREIFAKPPTRPRSRRQSLASALRVPNNLKSDIKKIWDRRPSLSGAISRMVKKDEKEVKHEDDEVKMEVDEVDDDDETFDTDEVAREYGVPPFYIVDAKAWEKGIRIKTSNANDSLKKK